MGTMIFDTEHARAIVCESPYGRRVIDTVDASDMHSALRKYRAIAEVLGCTIFAVHPDRVAQLQRDFARGLSAVRNANV